jgi:hypothetical protein
MIAYLRELKPFVARGDCLHRNPIKPSVPSDSCSEPEMEGGSPEGRLPRTFGNRWPGVAGAGTPVLVCSTCRSTSTSSDVARKTSVRSGQHIGVATSNMLRIASLLITGLLRTTSSRVRMQWEPLGFSFVAGAICFNQTRPVIVLKYVGACCCQDWRD